MLNLQAFMDEVIDVIMRDDVDGYVDMISLPYQLITATETRSFLRPADLRDHFALFKIGLQQLGFEGLSHHVLSTTMLGESLATGIYETRLYRTGNDIIAPYRSCITLRLTDSKWRAVSTAHTVGHADWVERMQLNAEMNAKNKKD